MRHLDLFSGIGGFALAARNVGWETVGFCEIDPYCQKVLAKHWPDVPIYDDVRKLNGDTIGPIDILTGGYPCQPFSLAGQRRGEDDDRHLWPEAYRLVREIKPGRVVFENVAGHITMGLDDVLSDLESIGYACEAIVIPACAVDAKHRRDRVWIIGSDTVSEGLHERNVQPGICRETKPESGWKAPKLGREASSGKILADPKCGGRSRQGEPIEPGDSAPNSEGKAAKPVDGCLRSEWCPEPGVGRVADGVPSRVDRLRGLGNAIVPQVAEVIFRAINATVINRQTENNDG